MIAVTLHHAGTRGLCRTPGSSQPRADLHHTGLSLILLLTSAPSVNQTSLTLIGAGRRLKEVCWDDLGLNSIIRTSYVTLTPGLCSLIFSLVVNLFRHPCWWGGVSYHKRQPRRHDLTCTYCIKTWGWETWGMEWSIVILLLTLFTVPHQPRALTSPSLPWLPLTLGSCTHGGRISVHPLEERIKRHEGCDLTLKKWN